MSRVFPFHGPSPVLLTHSQLPSRRPCQDCSRLVLGRTLFWRVHLPSWRTRTPGGCSGVFLSLFVVHPVDAFCSSQPPLPTSHQCGTVHVSEDPRTRVERKRKVELKRTDWKGLQAHTIHLHPILPSPTPNSVFLLCFPVRFGATVMQSRMESSFSELCPLSGTPHENYTCKHSTGQTGGP